MVYYSTSASTFNVQLRSFFKKKTDFVLSDLSTSGGTLLSACRYGYERNYRREKQECGCEVGRHKWNLGEGAGNAEEMNEFQEPVGWFTKSTGFPPRVIHVRIRDSEDMTVVRVQGAFPKPKPMVVLADVPMASEDLGSTAILFTGRSFENIVGFSARDE